MTPAAPTRQPGLSLSGLLLLLVLIAGGLGALVLWLRADSPYVRLPVLKRDLPAYYQIQPDDLVEHSYGATGVTTDTLRTAPQISGRYTLTAMPAGQPLRDSALGPVVETTYISGTVALGLPATPAMVLGGSLRAGDVIDLLVVPAITPTSTPTTPLVLENILVLDVKPQGGVGAGAESQPDESSVVIVALPLNRRSTFVAQSANGTVFLTRQLSP